ncbi:MAG: branched-chain amino acid ABC transporter permease [Epsilonproteobacteria bacterium]|nr:branched-chain amino acid ABC transporter permease [Campylobacterota bacterium]
MQWSHNMRFFQSYAMKKQLWIIVVIIIAAILPTIIGAFWINVAVEILIMGLFAVSFNMIFGYMGQLSFGHAAFYGVGAYTVGLLMAKLSIPFSLSLIAAMLSAGAFALIIGYFCIRLTGIYFAILTLSFGQLIYYIVFEWYSFTGGDNGLQGIAAPHLLSSVTAYYYFTLVIVIAALIVMWYISRSPFGYTMRAIRDNANRTRFLGINVKRYMLINFVIAGAFAGLAGGLWGPFNQSISPDLLNWTESGIPVFMTVIGGSASFLGPMVGSIIYTFLNAFVTGFTQYWPLIIGIVIMLIILFSPGGIQGLIDKWYKHSDSSDENIEL